MADQVTEQTGTLFWYPGRAEKDKYGEFDKEARMAAMIGETFDRLQSLFVYEGLPDEVPAKWLEHYLMSNGTAIFTKLGDKYYVFNGHPGAEKNAYYVPLRYVVADPWVKLSDGNTLSKEFIIEDHVWNGKEVKADCVMIRNDTFAVGLLPMVTKYCRRIMENEITMELASILARATINISASDDRTRSSAEVWIKRLIDGELGIMSETPFIEGLNVREFKEVANCLVPLIEYHQYTKASFLNDIGLNANYNMKREAINSNESQLNDDMLKPLIDNMLQMRQEAVEEINKMYGLNITVEFNSAWKSNEETEDAEVSKLEAEVESTEAEADVLEAEAEAAKEATDDPEGAADDQEGEAPEGDDQEGAADDETEENEDTVLDEEGENDDTEDDK